MRNPYAQYQEQRVQHASPGERVLMLYDGALRFLRGAQVAMEDGDPTGQQHNLERVQGVLLGLISSLNLNQGGELAHCLLRIYEYCYNRLCDASSVDDLSAVREVSALLADLRGAWADAASQVEEPEAAVPALQMAMTM